jgi:aldehyde:ferredoxin oxidoreductase
MEPVSEGVAAGKIPVGLDEAIVDYYRYRGWDDKGYPTAATLKDLDMESIPD